VILPYMTKQILYATMADFKNLLQHKSIKFLDFIHPQIGEKAAELALGSCVMVLVDGVYRFYIRYFWLVMWDMILTVCASYRFSARVRTIQSEFINNSHWMLEGQG